MAERGLSSHGILGTAQAQAQLLLLHQIKALVATSLHTACPCHLEQSVGGGAFAVVATILHQVSCWKSCREAFAPGALGTSELDSAQRKQGQTILFFFLSPRFYFYSLGIINGLCW